MATHTYTDPTVIWRLHREVQNARAVIVQHVLQATLLWWIDDQIDGAEDFLEWSGALKRADAVRGRLLGDGWIESS